MKRGYIQFDDAVLHHPGRSATAIVVVTEAGRGYAVGLYETHEKTGKKMAAQIMEFLRGRPFWSQLVDKLGHLVTDSAENQRVCNDAILAELEAKGKKLFKLNCQELGLIVEGAIS